MKATPKQLSVKGWIYGIVSGVSLNMHITREKIIVEK